MPDKTSNTIQPQVGMVTDTTAFTNKKGSWVWAYNVNVESLDGEGLPIPQNEHSNFLFVVFPPGYVVVGHKYIKEKDRVIYFLANPSTGMSQIGEVAVSKCFVANTEDSVIQADCKTCGGYELMEPVALEKQQVRACATYYTIAESACLNCDVNYPVDIEYKLTNCDLRLYFTDNHMPRRFVYMDFLSNNRLKVQQEFYKATGFDAACNAPIYGPELDCNKMLIQPTLSRGCMAIADVVSGGQCQSGTYQFYTSYADANGNQLSEYWPGTNPVPIHHHDVVIQDDHITDKGILLSVIGLDYGSYYRYYNIAVRKVVNGTAAYYLIASLPIGQRTFFFSDNVDTYSVLTEQDLFKRPAYWKTARFVTSSNGILMWGGMKESPLGNWQRVASQVKLQWQTSQIPLDSYKDPRLAEKYKGLLRDEVYPFGLVFEFDNGEETDYLHIPGRVATAADMENVTGDDSFDPEGCIYENPNAKWRAYNTASVVANPPHEPYEPCSDGIWEYGDFGYWESSDKYPDNEEIWGSLRCTAIRHHKVPDCTISPMYDGLNLNNIFSFDPMIYPIGVRPDHQSIYNAVALAITDGYITQEMADRITGYRIVRGNRAGNESIQAKGLMYDVWGYDKEDKHWYYPNYPFNDTRPDPFIANTDHTYDRPDSTVKNEYKNTFTNTGRYTFHSPDTHFRNPAIGSELKIETVAYGEAQGYFHKVEDHPKYKFLSVTSQILAMAVGFAAAMAVDKKQCTTLTKQGPLASLLGVASGTAYTVPAGIPPSIYVGQIHDYTGDALSGAPAGLDLLSTKEEKNQCTGRFRDFLPAPQWGIPFTPWLNPWKAGEIVGPHKGDINPLAIAMPLAFLTAGIPPFPRAIFDIFNSFLETDKFATTLEFIIPWKNMAYQYQAVGKYNNYKLPAQGNIRRKITDFSYLKPDALRIAEKDINGNSITIDFNNYWRESSVYFKIDGTLPDSSTYAPDTSRFAYSESSGCDPDKRPTDRVTSNVSSYYAAVKTPRDDQYGTVYDIDYIETGHCSYRYYDPANMGVLDHTTVYGGDTFITQWGLKRKHSFFTDTAYGLPDGSDFNYQERGNAGFPNYYFITKQPLGERLAGLDISNYFPKGSDSPVTILAKLEAFVGQLVSDVGRVIGVPINRFDCDTKPFLYQYGKIYLYSYGIPYFICESSVNTDLRTARDTKAGDFYPRVQDLDYWLQERNVPIREDNQYHYNKDYSKQNVFGKGGPQLPSYKPNKDCVTSRDNLMIYSTDSEGDNSVPGYDRWLENLVADQHEFPLSNGRMISAEGIENDKVLVRFEHNMAVFNAYVTLNTSADKAIISTGDLFKSKPQEFSRTDIGNLGTRHKAILNTDMGHVTVDTERGNILVMELGGAGMDDLAKYGNRDWFQQNLPFQIKKDFPYIPDEALDNNYKGLGIALGYDKRFKRLFLTKLDYKVLRSDILWGDGEFYIPHKRKVIVDSTTKTCPAGWTLSADGTLCTRQAPDTPATPTGVNVPFTAGERTYQDYSDFGTYIYKTNRYNSNGTAFTSADRYLIPTQNNKFWINDPRQPDHDDHYPNGPLNRCGIWNKIITGGDEQPIQTPVGAVVVLNFPVERTIYVGCAGDNKVQITLGCTMLVDMDPVAMSDDLGIHPNISAPFRWWHIYPVVVPAGTSYLKIAGINFGQVAVFGAEIYFNTYEELIIANGYATSLTDPAVDKVRVFWSTDMLKNATVDNFEYSCPGCQFPLKDEHGNYWCKGVQETRPPDIVHIHKEEEIIEREIVCLQDKRYFCDRSWTAAFRMDYKFLVGFYPFRPNFYTGFDTFFQTGINVPCGGGYGSSVWSHLLTNKSYQVFYGRFHAWELQLRSEARPDFSVLEYVGFKTEFWRYLSEEDRSLKQNRTLNKAIVFNDRQCTGMLKLHMPTNDHSIRYPYVERDQSAMNVRIDYHEGQYSFNYLFDHTFSQYNGVPFMVSDCATWRKDLFRPAISYLKPARTLGHIRSEAFQVRFINDIYSNYKILFHWINFFTSQSQV